MRAKHSLYRGVGVFLIKKGTRLQNVLNRRDRRTRGYRQGRERKRVREAKEITQRRETRTVSQDILRRREEKVSLALEDSSEEFL